MPWHVPIALQHPLPRGVYEAPYYDPTGAVILIAVTASHQLIASSLVRDEVEYSRLYEQLQRELDSRDPVRLRLEG